MRTVLAVLASLLLSISTHSIAAPAEGVVIKTGFLSGNTYRDLSPQGKRGYVMGYTDGLFVSPLVNAPKSDIRWLEQCVVGMTDVQIVAILDKWLADNPARWHEQMNVLAYSAFRQACPK